MVEDLIPIDEASKLIGVSIDTLRRWDKSGKLLAIRPGKGSHRQYRKSDIELFIRDLFQVAKVWSSHQLSQKPNEEFYCPNSSIFQARLNKMESELDKIESVKEIFPLIVAVTGEIGNNSFDHNLGNWPDIIGIFFGYDLIKRVIVLADRGQGILKTLQRVKPELEMHNEALRVAFTEKISGRAPENRGNGLKFVKQVVADNPISLIFHTGNAKLEMQAHDTKIKISTSDSSLRGCLALIRF